MADAPRRPAVPAKPAFLSGAIADRAIAATVQKSRPAPPPRPHASVVAGIVGAASPPAGCDGATSDPAMCDVAGAGGIAPQPNAARETMAEETAPQFAESHPGQCSMAGLECSCHAWHSPPVPREGSCTINISAGDAQRSAPPGQSGSAAEPPVSALLSLPAGVLIASGRRLVLWDASHDGAVAETSLGIDHAVCACALDCGAVLAALGMQSGAIGLVVLQHQRLSIVRLRTQSRCVMRHVASAGAALFGIDDDGNVCRVPLSETMGNEPWFAGATTDNIGERINALLSPSGVFRTEGHAEHAVADGRGGLWIATAPRTERRGHHRASRLEFWYDASCDSRSDGALATLSSSVALASGVVALTAHSRGAAAALADQSVCVWRNTRGAVAQTHCIVRASPVPIHSIACDGAGERLWLGLANGSVRVIALGARGWYVLAEWPAHSGPVHRLALPVSMGVGEDRKHLSDQANGDAASKPVSHQALGDESSDPVSKQAFGDEGCEPVPSQGHAEDGCRPSIGSAPCITRHLCNSAVSWCAADPAIRVWDARLAACGAVRSVLQQRETWLHHADETVALCTWNVAGRRPSQLRDVGASFWRAWVLGEQADNSPTCSASSLPLLVVFGLQEVVDLEGDRAGAAASVVSRAGSASRRMAHGGTDAEWQRTIDAGLAAAFGPGAYAPVAAEVLVGLYVGAYVRRDGAHRVSSVGQDRVATGLGGLHGNKGGLALRLALDASALCFVVAHLPSGVEAVGDRNRDLRTILERSVFSPLVGVPEAVLGALEGREQAPVVLTGDARGCRVRDHEWVFVLGDLNYRLGLPRREADEILRAAAASADPARAFAALAGSDQLLRQLRMTPMQTDDPSEVPLARARAPGHPLAGFVEGALAFPPTYKYDVGRATYDSSSAQRVPAYCDRVLARPPCGAGSGALRVRRYGDVRAQSSSDHRPVGALLSVRLCAVDGAALFSAARDAWREALGGGV